jgi:hypothetical protein
MLRTDYPLSTTTTLPFAEAVERVRAALKEAGFGVLREIDIQATLREKLGVELEPYLILVPRRAPAVQRRRTAGVRGDAHRRDRSRADAVDRGERRGRARWRPR